MAKIKKVGQALVLTTTITAEDFDKVEKFKPEALELRNEKGELTFKVMFEEGGVSKYGVSFNSVNREKYLQITMMTYANSKENIIESYATVLVNINKIEAQVAAALDEVNALFASVEGSIEVE